MSRNPRRVEALEKRVIGALLIEPSAFWSISLQSVEFSTRWRKVYEAIVEAVFDGEAVTPEAISSASGVPVNEVAACQQFVGSVDKIAEYAGEVRAAALDRGLRTLGRELAGSDLWGDELLATAQARIAQLGLTVSVKEAEHVRGVAREVVELAARRARGEEVKTGDIETDLPPIDDYLALFAGNVCTIAGRPSMGKSAFTLWLMMAFLMRGEGVLLFSTESTKAEVVHRLLGLLTGISSRRIARRRVRAEELDALRAAEAVVAGWPLWIDDQHVDLPGVAREIRRLKAREGVKHVVIDHVQELNPGQGWRRGDLRPIDAVLVGLRDACREAPASVLWLVAQLNRGVEQREDKRPLMSDLRESGKLEEVSHMVLLLYRAAYYYSKAAEESPWRLQVAVAKNRNGPTGRLTAHWSDEVGQVKGVYDDFNSLWEMDPMHGRTVKETDPEERPQAPKQDELLTDVEAGEA